MGDVNTLLNQRLKKGEQTPNKMAALARQSASGNLTSFSGIFSVTDLSDTEKGYLESILKEYGDGENHLKEDLHALISITSEVKAITNQAAILHGERIKKAQTILTRYRDGAFTAWLLAAYGNRQTPYNFLQYYEFYEAMPKPLRPLIEAMPRQAVYTLASREGPIKKKQSIVEGYKGETKQELLILIRELFPLEEEDRRRKNVGEKFILDLKRLELSMTREKRRISTSQKRAILELLKSINTLIG